MNFGSSFSRNEIIDLHGGNWVRNDRIITKFSDGDSSHPSTSSESTPTKVTLPQFFAKLDPMAMPIPKKQAKPTMVTQDEKREPLSHHTEKQSKGRMDPPGVLADDPPKRHRKSSQRSSKPKPVSRESSSRRHKEERRKKKDTPSSQEHQQSSVPDCCDETTVSWTRVDPAKCDLNKRVEDSQRSCVSRRASNDGQLLRLKATKIRNHHSSCLEGPTDLTSTTTKTSSSASDVGEITEIIKRIQSNPKSPSPRRIRHDRRSMLITKRTSREPQRGMERKKSATRLTMVASPRKMRKGGTTTTNLEEESLDDAKPIPTAGDGKPDNTSPRRSSSTMAVVVPLDFSEFEEADFSGVDEIEHTAKRETSFLVKSTPTVA